VRVAGRRVATVAAGLIVAATVIAPVAPPAVASGPDPAGAAAITQTRKESLSPRLLEFGLQTAALPAETNLRVLLPEGYDAQPSRRWPVLYLLHGCCDYDVPGSRAWTTHGEAEAATASLPAIVVMPDAGRGGFYSDWRMPGTMGQPQWETYHLGQLMPWIEREFRTMTAREGRIIAGLSMGGYGTMKYASLHPDWFVAAATFSGAVNTNDTTGNVAEALSAQDGGYPSAVWGPRATDEIRWRGDNPWDLAENLRPLQLTLRTGNGQPGPLDAPGGAPYDPIEGGVHTQTLQLHDKLMGLKIAHVFDDYGPGTHSWPYWARDLQQTLGDLKAVLADPPAPPSSVTYTSIDPQYAIFGWDVALDRPALEFSRLSDAQRDGFVLEGSGGALVRTPGVYPKGAPVPVKVDGPGGVADAPVLVDGDGRLKIAVPLGPPSSGQQYVAGTTTNVGRATVRIVAPAVGSSGQACVSRRVFVVTLPRGARGLRATVGGRVMRVRGGRVRVDLRGRPAGVVRLVVTGRTKAGRPLRIERRYRTCAKRR